MAGGRRTGALVAVISMAMAFFSILLYNKRIKTAGRRRRSGVVGAISNTPLIRINNLSDATGCDILGKCEFLNPGGSVKDRVAVKIIQEALESGALAPDGVVTEGSVGSTAISLATELHQTHPTVAPAYGCKCHVVIPDDAAIEKSQIIEALGATVERVRPVSITHRDHFVNIARRRASEANEVASKHRKDEQTNGKALEKVHGFHNEEEKQIFPRNCPGGYFADQFENLAQFRAHYKGTGPEIWQQTGGKIDAFVAAAGTGGTVAGISMLLQEKKSKLDGAFRGTDKEAVEFGMLSIIGPVSSCFCLGSSSAMNCVGAVRVAQSIGPGHTIVTILCDSGMRHLSKFYNTDYLSKFNLTPSASGLEFMGVSDNSCN